MVTNGSGLAAVACAALVTRLVTICSISDARAATTTSPSTCTSMRTLVEIVGRAAGKHRHGFELLRPPELRFGPPLLGDVTQDRHDRMERSLGLPDRCHPAGEFDHAAAGPLVPRKEDRDPLRNRLAELGTLL